MKQHTRLKRSAKVARIRASVGGKTDFSADGAEGRRLPRGWHLKSRRERRPPKKRITMYMDADVVAWFKNRGPRYQRQINEALRELMMRRKRMKKKF